VPVDRNNLPKDPEILQQMLVDLTSQLDKTQRLLAQLLAAKSSTRSEQLSADQLRLFTQELAQELGVVEAATEAENDSNRTTIFRQAMAPAAVMRVNPPAGTAFARFASEAGTSGA
jgi:hypothetical protein